MVSIFIAIFAFTGYILAYRFYGAFLSKRIFAIDPERITPAHEFEDGVDFVPTKKSILFGHHFTSIAGAAPIVGPAIAVIWGWLPALLWVVFGSIFMGAVHDFGALVVSARNRGRTIGDITKDLVGPRAKTLFLLLIFFALLIVLAVFALVISVLFIQYPASVLPVWISLPIAVALGFYFYRWSGSTFVGSAVALVLLYVSIYIGTLVPITIPAFIMGNAILTWVVLLLIYAFFASILPVWVLLQPRDYINSQQLLVGLGLLYLGLFVARPEMVAPAINPSPEGAPMLIPFLFITIACGAISGFHCLVSSGTTVKQLNSEKDMRLIGYGSMLGEGVLSTMAILACTAGFASAAAWKSHYSSWGAAEGLGAKVGAFVEGGASFMAALGIPHEIGTSMVAVLVICFAATTLDSATRIQRYVVTELAEDFSFNLLSNRYTATLVAVTTAFLLSMINNGKGGLILWPLFGTVNQLLAALAFLTITIYLVRERRPIVYTFVPMVFMFVVTTWAMLVNLSGYVAGGKWLLVGIGIGIFVLEIWLVLEAFMAIRGAPTRGGAVSVGAVPGPIPEPVIEEE